MASGQNLVAKLLCLHCLRLEIGERRLGDSNVGYKQEWRAEDVGSPVRTEAEAMLMEALPRRALGVSVSNGPELKETGALHCVSEFILIKIKSPVEYCTNHLLEYHLA